MVVKDTDKIIPIIDCPICKTKDVPLSLHSTMTKKSHPNIEIWECTSCGKVPNLTHNIKIKKYISVKELEQMGWTK